LRVRRSRQTNCEQHCDHKSKAESHRHSPGGTHWTVRVRREGPAAVPANGYRWTISVPERSVKPYNPAIKAAPSRPFPEERRA
jgi:hypothetical protein